MNTDADARPTRTHAVDHHEADDYPASRRGYGLTRALMTLLSAAGAGVLIWLAHTFEWDATGEYWAIVGLLAAAGLALALGQLLGGWTKWGWPRLSLPVFLLGFLPALVAGGLVLLANQPDGATFQEGAADWADGLGVAGLVGALGEHLGPIALALGALFGFTLDTSGPRMRAVVHRRDDVTAVPVEDRGAADEPLTAERDTAARHEPHDRDDVVVERDTVSTRDVRDEDDVAVATPATERETPYVGDTHSTRGAPAPEPPPRRGTPD